jgi:chorismate lyase/3-hydroxybenzoate synthase
VSVDPGRLAGAGIFERLRPEAGMPVLAPAGARLDAWLPDGDPALHRHGCVRYAIDGRWLYGCAELADATLAGGMQAAAYRVYADLFAVLASNRSPYLLRLWNYFAGINRQSEGQERYRLFNVGRQQAFIEAQRSVLEGSPAACALGNEEGPLRVYFIAGSTPPLAIENPRQVSAYRYPNAYGPRSPTFSRAALAEIEPGLTGLFVSGTASIVGHETVHLGDVRRQAEESLTNIAALREVAAARGAALAAADLRYTVYVRDAADLGVVREVFESAVGSGTAAAHEAVYLRGDICRAELLVEIEAHGFTHTGIQR